MAASVTVPTDGSAASATDCCVCSTTCSSSKTVNVPGITIRVSRRRRPLPTGGSRRHSSGRSTGCTRSLSTVGHDDFWRDEALRKLPALLDATAMLACGEDLGMIPACVPEVMERLGILSLEIERMPKTAGTTFGDPRQYPYLSVGTTSTHDMSPLRSWWCGRHRPHAALFLRGAAPPRKGSAECTPALCRQIVRRTLDGQSMLAVLPLQDWLATDGGLRRDDPDEERINRPDDPSNDWRYRMHLTIEELLASAEFNRSIKRMLRTSDRTDKP